MCLRMQRICVFCGSSAGNRTSYREAAVSLGQALAARGVRLTKVFTSPLVRAVQTTEILVQHMHPECDVPVAVHMALSAERGTTAQALMPLDQASSDETIALVTHMPKVSALAAHLTGSGRFEPFTTGAAYLIEMNEGVGRVVLNLAPER